MAASLPGFGIESVPFGLGGAFVGGRESNAVRWQPCPPEDMMREFGSDIYTAVRSGKLAQPFNSAMVKQACPGWAEATYHTFLGKHAVGNGRTTELFVRVGRGQYRLNRRFA
jgi:hypothetical protein